MFCAKCYCHCYKYEVAINIITHEIVFIYGPVPGSFLDQQINRQSRLTDKLSSGEAIWADKAWRHSGPKYLTPYPEPVKKKEHEDWNDAHSDIHFCVIERVNGRLKFWKCLCIPWRGDRLDHMMVFTVICNIYNISLEYHPLNKKLF